MTITTYADIYTGKTQLQIEAEILALFPPGFPIKDWKPGGTELTNIQIEGKLLEDIYILAGQMLASGYLDTAEGDWLTLLAYAFFQENRNDAVFTKGKAVLSLAAGSADQVITPGQLWVQTDTGVRFTNLTGGTVKDVAPLTIDIQAEFAGAAANVPTGSITVLGTPLPGMTVSNPVFLGGTWITQFGANIESDRELRIKCAAKWGSLGNGAPETMYIYWARKSSAVVKKVKVFRNYLGGFAWPGGVTVYLAGDGGPVDAATVATVKSVLATKIPNMARLAVESAVSLLISVAGPVKLSKDAPPTEQTACRTRIDSYATVLDIGGDSGWVYRSEIIGAVVAPPGGFVRRFEPTKPLSDLRVNRNQVVSFESTGLAFTT